MSPLHMFRTLRQGPLRVAVIGSGNWGTVAARMIAQNTQSSYLFESQVKMYVYEELVDGKPLTEIINSTHENVKYLPGVSLPNNLVANKNLVEVVQDSNLLVFVTPHQFMRRILSQIKDHILPSTMGISLTKGFDVQDGKLKLMSEMVRDELSIECAALSGANVASQIAEEEFSEATIACRNTTQARLFQQLFHRPYFRIRCTNDVEGVELCGALKNVIAIACGFVDGLGLGSNSKAAIIRIGLDEIRRLSKALYGGVDTETFFESCGVADLITTCYAGRNRKCAEIFARTGQSFDEIEREVLKGQKLQGTLTAREVHEVLQARGLVEDFPLMTQTYRICFENEPALSLIHVFMSEDPQ